MGTVRFFDSIRNRPSSTQVSPSVLIDDWTQLVAEVERGYELGLDDYANDLSVREMLAESEGQGRLVPAAIGDVASLDERFRQATRELSDTELMHVYPGAAATSLGWWELRVPLLLVGELVDDLTILEREGATDA